MQAIAGDELVGRDALVLDEAEGELSRRFVLKKTALEGIEAHTKRAAADLHHASPCPGERSEELRGFGKAFAAEHADLDSVAGVHGGDDGRHSRGDEVNVAWLGSVLEQDRSEGKRHMLAAGRKVFARSPAESFKETILKNTWNRMTSLKLARPGKPSWAGVTSATYCLYLFPQNSHGL